MVCSRWLSFCATLIVSLDSWGCALISSNRDFRIYGGSPNTQVLLVTDSPEVRQVLTDEDAREEGVNRYWREAQTPEERRERIEDMTKHPEHYPSSRSEFLQSMARMPGVYVPERSYCRVIQRSKSTCGPTPIETAVYVMVSVTTGASRGRQGWVCESSIQKLSPFL